MLLKLICVLILIFFTAFFVAAEFAIVRVRKSRVEALSEKGEKKAKDGLRVLKEMDAYLSSCQLGITMASLGIGWLGEPVVEGLLEPLLHTLPFSSTLSFTISGILAFLIITLFHVVFGELAPKSMAIQKAEVILMWSAKPLIWFSRIAFPFIWLLNRSANAVSRLFGIKPMGEAEEVHTEEELRLLLSESYQSGEINQAEYRYVNRIFDFDDRVAREIMVPRTELICLFVDRSLEENKDEMKRHTYTRYPIAKGDKDHIVGVINIKELYYSSERFDSITDPRLEAHIRPILRVHETMPIKQLLLIMQKKREHMAILVDEYGGTSGMVTVEDILEEIVGEIRDEFDEDERATIEQIGPGRYLVDGKTLTTDINRQFHTHIEHEDIDTIAGLILADNPDLMLNEVVQVEHLEIKVHELEGSWIKSVEIYDLDEAEQSNA
ncbi:hemolysin family protein [Pullulanibacillus sp. KACC 23026]|uniref:hemolysin family protein n=1 Tax=Pullulanibacillus sp. KACC 23026 TaxID=3028315 RepID=UPI0023B0450F|nr:hemolysin family protein [Pullulanibacillus sp. KACC 23026]WEG11770.1 hemolysin family protein [Pullulanibacillus sp. KACC 23026]